jgi:hypothetical protein
VTRSLRPASGQLAVRRRQSSGVGSLINARELPDHAAQTRYWSLCIVLTCLHTGDCLRDEHIHLKPHTDRFTVIISPSCPVAHYRNCLHAGPQPLQRSLSFRLLLPNPTFRRHAFHGSWQPTARYVSRPN